LTRITAIQNYLKKNTETGHDKAEWVTEQRKYNTITV